MVISKEFSGGPLFFFFFFFFFFYVGRFVYTVSVWMVIFVGPLCLCRSLSSILFRYGW